MRQKVVSRITNLYVQQMFEKANATVRIFCNTPGTKFNLRGFVNSSFMQSGRNSWDDSSGDGNGKNYLGQENAKLQLAQSVGGVLSSIRNTSAYQAIGNLSVRSVLNSIPTYGGSEIPSFEVDMMMLNFDESRNILDDVTAGQAMVLPNKVGNLVTVNPLGYMPYISDEDFKTKGSDVETDGNVFEAKGDSYKGSPGSITLGYGKYFFAVGLICEHYSFILSPEVVEDGTPMYAIIKARFRPRAMIDIYQYRRYFRGITSNFENQTTPQGSGGGPIGLNPFSGGINNIVDLGTEVINRTVGHGAANILDLGDFITDKLGGVVSPVGEGIASATGRAITVPR